MVPTGHAGHVPQDWVQEWSERLLLYRGTRPIEREACDYHLAPDSAAEIEPPTLCSAHRRIVPHCP